MSVGSGIDCIVVGEVRDATAIDILSALNTGHPVRASYRQCFPIFTYDYMAKNKHKHAIIESLVANIEYIRENVIIFLKK